MNSAVSWNVLITDLYDDHTSPASAAQGLLYKAARKRKEVRINAW